MKKAILSTSLKLIPNVIQYKALTKALNYLFRDQPDMARFAGMVVSFKVTDLRTVWTLTCDGYEFSQYKKKKHKVDVTCLMRSNVALALYSKQDVLRALEQGDIEFEGEATKMASVEALLSGLDSNKIDNLVDHMRAFLRLKPIDRQQQEQINRLNLRASHLGIDLKTVTADQVTSREVVDLIRDAALVFESANTKEALRLMRLAKQGRPNGSVICRKVAEYEQALSQ
jgi:predicted lipid carrier protein YhbT